MPFTATPYHYATSYQLPATLFRPHQREEDHIPDRGTVRQQHDQPVDPDAFARRRRHAELQRPDVVLVHRMRLIVAAGALAELFLETPLLLRRVVQLAEGVRQLDPRGVQLEPFDGVRVIRLLF